jgi:hypothetical protein
MHLYRTREDKEKLRTSIPTVLQWNILGNFLNAARIRRDSVLHRTKLLFKTINIIKHYKHDRVLTQL